MEIFHGERFYPQELVKITALEELPGYPDEVDYLTNHLVFDGKRLPSRYIETLSRMVVSAFTIKGSRPLWVMETGKGRHRELTFVGLPGVGNCGAFPEQVASYLG